MIGTETDNSHRDVVVDAHYDLLSDVFRLRKHGERKVIERFFLEDVKKAGIDVLICSLFIPDAYLPEMALRHALDQIGMLHCEMEESPGLFSLCRNAQEVRKAIRDGRTALLLSFEGIEPIGNDLVLMRVFYELGVRFMGLTWSRRNYAADGCHFLPPAREGTAGGLTAFGVQVAEEAERLGMILDVSHLNDAGFSDVLMFSKKTFIASHSNCRVFANTPRNLTDDQIKSLAARGGVMGLNNMTNFVYESAEDAKNAKKTGPSMPPPAKIPEGKPRFEGFFDHIRHVIDLVGPDHIGFGFDLCEFKKPESERELSVFPTYRHTAPFIERIGREFPTAVAAKIRGGNWMRIIELLR